jgi:predicted transcriptional regulator
MADENSESLRTLVAEVAAAYFANSHVGVSEIAGVIDQIGKSLSAVGSEHVVAAAATPAGIETPPKATAAQIRRSVTPDAIVSFEDGRAYKTLRRHLTMKGLTPEQYREKWGLPRDYPMVAPSYSAQRSQLAKALGLGARGRRARAVPDSAPAPRARSGRKATPES